MATRVIIEENAIDVLEEIAKIHYGQALDALDYAGIKLRDATRKSFRNSTTNVVQFYKGGKWVGIKRVSNKQLGKRVSHKYRRNRDKTPSMENLITSNLIASKMTMIVAGKHGDLRPLIRRNGKIKKSAKLVKAVNKGSYAILQKLNYGDDGDAEYKKVRRTKAQAKFFKNTKWKKQNFIEKGRNNAIGQVRIIMTEKLAELLQKDMNAMNTQIRVRKTA